MSANDHVAVFWDYENRSPPAAMSGHDVVQNICEIAHRFGTVKQFRAYLDLTEQSSPRSSNLRAELQSSGVTLAHCPHDGRKDVVDKMMIVDMFTYAIDALAPSTIVLITSDRDFAYAISVLKFRKYRIVLIAPNTGGTSLKAQASMVFDWDADILAKRSIAPLPDASPVVHPYPSDARRTTARSKSVLSTLSKSINPHDTNIIPNWSSPLVSIVRPTQELGDDSDTSSYETSSSGSSLAGECTQGETHPVNGQSHVQDQKLSPSTPEPLSSGVLDKEVYPGPSYLGGCSSLIPSSSIANSQVDGPGNQARGPSGKHRAEAARTALLPHCYNILLQIMQKCRDAGVNQPLRSVVGNAILQWDRNTYSRPGWPESFAAYTGEAERLGLVTLGGNGGYCWIALRSEWYGAQAVDT